jgi:glycosyltransferase involved in cell wall biosynthesis
MAAGLPVVAVAGPGTSDIVDDGEQGYLVQNDPQDLAKRMVEMICNPDAMSEFKAGSLKKSRAFDNKRLARKMLKVYEQAIRDKMEGQSVAVQDKAALVEAQQVAA